MLDIPPSTLRRYSADYGEQLSESARTKGKKRRYTETDILILRKIRKLSRDRLTPDEIADRLQIVDDNQEQEPGSALALLPQIAQAFESINTQMAEMRDNHAAQIAALQEQLDAVAGELEAERRRSWWDRLRGK